MNSNIVSQNGNSLPRAVAKEKDGVVLYWVEELGVAGIHVRGLASLLDCNAGNLNKLLGCVDISFLEVEVVTAGGVQGVYLMPGKELAKALRAISRSKSKAAMRDRADDLRDRLVEAGFNISVMMNLAPAELAARAVSHLDKQLELARIENEGKAIERDTELIRERTQNFRHYLVTALPKPTADRILGTTVVHEIEYRDRIVKEKVVINDGSTINKTEICKLFGITTKSGSADFKALNRKLSELRLPESAWEETDVIQTNRELKREYLPQLERSLYTAAQRQLWIGENSNPD
jgi:hypothetical protein